MSHDRIRLLVDNSSLDSILNWSRKVQARFLAGIATKEFVVYLAPETIAEMFSIGATSRASKLQALASLTLDIFNGRILNHYFSRILDEVRGHATGPFMPASMASRVLENLRHFATGGPPPEPDWFRRGAEMVMREKTDDRGWRTEFQKMYRVFNNRSCSPLDEFCRSRTVRDLTLSRVQAICAEAGVRDPRTQASEILDRGFACCSTLATHVWIRIARLWWYTESTRDGRHVSDDLFDDAMLNYLYELDLLLTPDCALANFVRAALPEMRLLSPDAFRRKYLVTTPHA